MQLEIVREDFYEECMLSSNINVSAYSEMKFIM